MKILYDNILEDLEPSTPVLMPGYIETSYIYTQQLADSIRFTVGGLRIFEYDLGASPDAYKAFSVAGHNISSAGTVTVKTGTTPGFSTAVNSVVLSGSPQLFGELATEATDRYIRFEIDDTTNPDGFVQIGRLMAGPLLDELKFSPLVTDDRLVRGTAYRTQSDQVYGEQRYNLKSISLEFPNIGVSQKQQVDAWIEQIGQSHVFIMHLDEIFDFGYDTLHVQRDGDTQSFELNTAKIYTTRINFLEAY